MYSLMTLVEFGKQQRLAWELVLQITQKIRWFPLKLQRGLRSSAGLQGSAKGWSCREGFGGWAKRAKPYRKEVFGGWSCNNFATFGARGQPLAQGVQGAEAAPKAELQRGLARQRKLQRQSFWVSEMCRMAMSKAYRKEVLATVSQQVAKSAQVEPGAALPRPRLGRVGG